MCTLTYYPTGKGSYILTSNRDESTRRIAASLPQCADLDGQMLVYPVDGEKGGTWFAISDHTKATVLMNGAYKPHIPLGSYRKSRGLILLESFQYPCFKDFTTGADLNGIEPFTMINIEMDGLIAEFRWDGNKHFKLIDPTKAAIWSAAQLYPQALRELSENRFRKFLEENKPITRKKLLAFNESESYLTKLARLDIKPVPTLKTRSIISLTKSKEEFNLRYIDREKSIRSSVHLPL